MGPFSLSQHSSQRTLLGHGSDMPSYAPPSNSSDLRVKGKGFPRPRDVTGAALVSSPAALLARSSHSSRSLFLQHLGRAPTYSRCSTQGSHPHPTPQLSPSLFTHCSLSGPPRSDPFPHHPEPPTAHPASSSPSACMASCAVQSA